MTHATLAASELATAAEAADPGARPAAHARRARGRAARVPRLVLHPASVPPAHVRGPAHAPAVPGLGGEPARLPAGGAAEGRGDPLQLPRPRRAARVDPAHRRPRRHPAPARAASSSGSGWAWRSACRARRWRTSGTCCRPCASSARAYVTFCKSKPWVQACASSLTELFAPKIHQQRLEQFAASTTRGSRRRRSTTSRAAWCRPRATCSTACRIVKQHCTTVETQRQAFEALAFKLDMLWAMIDTIHNAYRE